MNFSFKSLFAIWSLLPQRFHYYYFLSIVSWQYRKFLFHHSDTCAVSSVFNTVGLLILIKLCPVFTFLQQLLTKNCALFTHTRQAKTQQTENSNPHGFELHRPLSKGFKLLLQVIKAIINQSCSPMFSINVVVSAPDDPCIC